MAALLCCFGRNDNTTNANTKERVNVILTIPALYEHRSTSVEAEAISQTSDAAHLLPDSPEHSRYSIDKNKSPNKSIASIQETPLHTEHCRQHEEDLTRMENTIKSDPGALERLQPSYNSPYDVFPRVSPLHDACQRGHKPCLSLLVSSGANVNKRDRTGYHNNAIQYAYCDKRDTTQCRIDMMKYLKHRGAVLNNTAYDNYLIPSETLVSAVENHHNDIVQFLLENGGVTDKKRITEIGEQIYEPSNIYTPVFAALSVGNIFGYRLLMEHGASNRICVSDTSAFHFEYAIPHLIVNRAQNTEIALEALQIYRDYDGDILAQNLHVFDRNIAVPDVPQMGRERLTYQKLVTTDVIEYGISVLQLLENNARLRAHLPGLLEELKTMVDKT